MHQKGLWQSKQGAPQKRDKSNEGRRERRAESAKRNAVTRNNQEKTRRGKTQSAASEKSHAQKMCMKNFYRLTENFQEIA